MCWSVWMFFLEQSVCDLFPESISTNLRERVCLNLLHSEDVDEECENYSKSNNTVRIRECFFLPNLLRKVLSPKQNGPKHTIKITNRCYCNICKVLDWSELTFKSAVCRITESSVLPRSGWLIPNLMVCDCYTTKMFQEGSIRWNRDGIICFNGTAIWCKGWCILKLFALSKEAFSA